MPTSDVAEMTIPGFRDYIIDSDGNITSYCRGLPKRLNASFRSGYPSVSLIGPDKSRHLKYVHHLVLETFVGPKPTPTAIARHLDGNRANTHLTNLGWGEQPDQYRDRDRNGHTARGERQGQAKLSDAKVRAIRAARIAGRTLRSIADEFGSHSSMIHQIVTGQRWKHVA